MSLAASIRYLGIGADRLIDQAGMYAHQQPTFINEEEEEDAYLGRLEVSHGAEHAGGGRKHGFACNTEAYRLSIGARP